MKCSGTIQLKQHQGMAFSSLFQPAGHKSVLMHIWFARASESKTFLEHALCFSWKKHCVMPNVKSENPPDSNYQQQLEIIVVILSFQRKSEHYCRSCQKKQNTCEVRKLQGLCLWHMLKASLSEMSLERVKTTLWDFYKRKLIYYVDIMLIRQVTECSQTTLKVFFQIKACLVWKLCLISFPSQLTTMGLLRIQNFCSIICAIPLILLSSYFEFIRFVFSVSWK